MLLGLVVFGFLSVIVGMSILVKWIRSRWMLKTKGKYISGVVGFILIAFGLVLITAGMTTPFSV
jgi:hypothetical protein